MILQITKGFQSNYLPSKSLLAAINTALFLNKPLLISGKPGTGKTECADFVAGELMRNYPKLFKLPYALRYNTKSTSQFTDLFYQYDVVGHFADKEKTDKARFFSLATLGLAIAATHNQDMRLVGVGNYAKSLLDTQMPCGSVVLVDEIDKAPRDFPNDLLAELEKAPLKFKIRELNDLYIEQDEAFPIAVIITSNNEKSLPEAFLRRCVFHYIDPPSKEQLIEILKIKALYQQLSDPERERIPLAIDTFIKLRSKQLNKQPSTSELIDWIICLHHHRLLDTNAVLWSKASAGEKSRLKDTLYVLAKSQADFDIIAADLRD